MIVLIIPAVKLRGMEEVSSFNQWAKINKGKLDVPV